MLLPDQLGDLSKGRTTQVEVSVVDSATHEVLLKKSNPIQIRSISSIDWMDDEFAVTSTFHVLAWMRPTCEEVDAINRAAGDRIATWVEGASIAGYQYGFSSMGAMLQVAAIQSAISDTGVVYQSDGYSLTGGQNVLTPDMVVRKKQGLRIETSLLMASCTKCLQMHPMRLSSGGQALRQRSSYAFFASQPRKRPPWKREMITKKMSANRMKTNEGIRMRVYFLPQGAPLRIAEPMRAR